MEKIIRLSDKYENELIDIRRKIHKNPELSHKEYETSKLVEEHLKDLDIESIRIGDTGIMGILKAYKPGKTLVLRADMDALPIDEETDLSYKSKNKDVMHACGHDVHTANLLIVGKILKELRSHWTGTVKLIFQPAEERGGGAKDIIDAGVLENPKVDLALALHVMPIRKGQILINHGNIMAASDGFVLKIKGKKAHTRRPQDGVDAINIASHIVVALNSISSKNLDPLERATFSIGTIKGGTATNVVADEVELKGIVRTLDESARKSIKENIKKISESIAEAFGGKCEFDFHEGYPSVLNQRDNTEIISNLFKKNSQMIYKGFNVENPSELILKDADPIMAADDFGFFSEKIPTVYYMVGTGDRAPNHSSKFYVDEDYIKLCTRTMVLAAINYLN